MRSCGDRGRAPFGASRRAGTCGTPPADEGQEHAALALATLTIGLAAVVADTRPWRRPAPAGEPPGDVGAIGTSMSVERETAWPSTQLKRCRETRPAKGLPIGVEVVQPAGFDARSSSRPDADSRPTRWREMDSNQRYGFPYCLARSQRLPALTFSVKSGQRFGKFVQGRRSLMAHWRKSWDARKRFAPSGLPTARTQSPSWFLAIGSSARMPALPAMAAASTANDGCSFMKAPPSGTCRAPRD